ncbi:type I Iterative Polyketide synthase (PKS) [Aspergillus brasiliensis]|uniref:Type I Iterative Polyketide synthase (PKS) n=1 Tax=Aspergillus brasiliensis TaxID=319629 RepID=A0A9W5YN42_9EURO|nr:type I Iterative Polyketide synthase (PKS) [Aspergillus brasiliensis]GKZ42751.1 type I Iterative Polyketide synthase (PKS) [Aspergillus brasiliensis]
MSVPEPIAIIGTGCRFPGTASSPSRLWDLLLHPRNVASKAPSDRFSHDAFYHPDDHHGTGNSPESYFLTEDPRAFDAPFFNVSRAEAESMDPQQRLLLEVVYESLEAAGLTLEALRGSDTGVYCGLMSTDYANLISHDWDEVPVYTPSGTAASILANRISFFFDWHGPSMTIDTACSSSLVALHQGVSALRNQDCQMALVAASNLIFSPREYIAASKMHLLSPTGRCRMWDESADGYARGEGIASLVLKRLSDAIADGDPIECIVRATGINADGRSMGITMPSSIAQSRLIRSTYASVGLNPADQLEDRCQFFEAHGTGTQAGDPQEATAIYNTFFGNSKSPEDSTKEPLYVGSIKTLIGHTEGVAGLAGVIKASLCVQKSVIPPNILLERINPVIAPLTSRLRIPTETLSWPNLAPGVPRRVSVNSFGFGGSNAHAIIESYIPPTKPTLGHCLHPQLLPFTFSAGTEKTLIDVLECYARFLREHPDIDLVSLAESLLKRRSAFSHRVFITAASFEALQTEIQIEIERRRSAAASSSITSQPSNAPKRVLGIFTGQGAQYPQMFWDMISASPQAMVWMTELQDSLDNLPLQYRPDFSMLQELSAPESSSRIREAFVSQPLRTAVQIIQVSFLRALGVKFSTVVGHSSGEIAAAYAAGAISATDAIRIAYLRGLVVQQAAANGQSGAMLACGIPWEEAQALCTEGGFSETVRVAASNSPVSVTFSGDKHAIQELEWMLQSLDLAVHHLHVDVAYHSHHMVPCAAPYLHALEACGIRADPTSTKWFSSVYKETEMGTEDVTPQYWCQNMLRPVLFSQAVTAAFADNPKFDLVIEVGPHPTLKAPVLQNIPELKDVEPQTTYLGLAERGRNCTQVFARAIGSLWAHLGANIDIHRYLSLFDNSYESRFVKHLPTYPFDKSRAYWTLSRHTKARLHPSDLPHPLLGTLSPETGENEWRWRNHLSRTELEWLNDHQVQTQAVFPAAGYISMVLEAAAKVARDRPLRLVEIDDVRIHCAVPIPDDPRGVEIISKLDIVESESNVIVAAFQCYASIAERLKTCASGKLTVLLGEQDVMLLPPRSSTSAVAQSMDIPAFYASLERLGLNYSGPFQGVKALARQSDGSMGIVSGAELSSSLLLHPAIIDSSLQTLLAARSIEEVHTLLVPVSIEHIAINPLLCKPGSTETMTELSVEAFLDGGSADGMTGDINVFDLEGHGVYQIEGFHVAPLSAPEDRAIFSKLAWGPLLPQAVPQSVCQDCQSQEELQWAERCSLLYIRDARQQLSVEECKHLDQHQSSVMEWMDHILCTTRDGTHPVCHPDWLEGTVEDALNDAMSTVPKSGDYWTSLRIAGESLSDFLKRRSEVIEFSYQEGQMDGVYKDPFRNNLSHSQLAVLVGQIAFRYPHMHILELNAGGGSATEEILKEIKRSYQSYTFTNTTPTFFATAQESLTQHKDRFVYQVLDTLSDPSQQGFKKHSYDLIVAADMMWCAESLMQSLANIRYLLKPGGYLVVRTGTKTNINRLGLIVSSFKKWWSDENGNPQSPVISLPKWDVLLKQTGFGGLEAVSSTGQFGYTSSFVTQAIDDRIQLVREPWDSTGTSSDSLLLIGGATEATSDVISALEASLRPFFRQLVLVNSLDVLDVDDVYGWCVLSLSDIDSPCYENITAQRLSSLKVVINSASRLLWVTSGPESRQPYLSMSKATIHCLAYENPQTIFQYLNIPDHQEVTASTLARIFMQLVHTPRDNNDGLDVCLHSTEFELQLVNGVLNIPRIRLDDSRNQRYSASHRTVNGLTDLQYSAVQVVAPSARRSEFFLYESSQYSHGLKECNGATHRRISVRFSTITTFKVEGAGFLHLAIGRDEHDHTRWLALSDQHASTIVVPLNWCWRLPDSVAEGLEASFLMRTAAALLATYIVDKGHPDTSIMIYKAETICKTLCDVVSAFALARNIRVLFGTSIQAEVPKSDVLYIHERSSSRTLSRFLPKDISVIVGCTQTASSAYNRIRSLLPEDVVQVNIPTMGRTSPKLLRPSSPITVGRTLFAACGFALQTATLQDEVQLVSVQDLQGTLLGPNQFEIVNWTQPGQVPIRIQTASSMVSLSAQRTYLLAGMAGDLGRSVCQWMISRGARNVVLGSRSPSVDTQWIGEMERLGARVVPMTIDVTNRESVRRAYASIRDSLPSIGGVANGAMVLKDCLFAQMTLDDLQSVMAPKVQGSIILEEVFGNMDLDFFILVGSAAGPLGNVGQTAYSAATEFMSALIKQRHEQGLVGSIIHPGLIKGVGYFARADSAVQNLIERNTGASNFTERDLHELFAEGILAGHPDSGRNPEVIAGYQVINAAENPNALWLRNPKAWNLISHAANPTASASGANENVPIRMQLELAKSTIEATEIITDGFIKEVRSRLQLSAEESLTGALALTEMGVDSLVAIELRHWFVRELSVDLPVLQIIGGSSIQELAGIAASKLPMEFTPDIKTEEVPTSGTDS